MKFWFGKLTWASLPHEWFTIGGALSMVLAGLGIFVYLTYTKKWKWLWQEWLTSTDPKKIGIMYFVVAALMLVRGGLDAGMIWLQQSLASGSGGYLTADHFQQIFTAHGTIMIFFVTTGFLFGLMNYILPLQIGARDVAFPLLNTLSFWLYAAGALFINLFFFFGGEFAATGWLAMPPLSELEFSPGVGVDYWIWSLQISGLGSLLSGVNLLVTILKMRAPGMTLMKMPMFVWTCLGSLLLVVSTFPILTMTLLMLSLDRAFGMHFFTSNLGGNPMLYVNLIWSWGHPEVYILMLPAFGIYSEIVATFSRRRLFGYGSLVADALLISGLSMLVWLHHFFTMGAGANVNAFFGIMTGLIAIPTGVQIFNWLATLYKGDPRFTSAMHWFFGFVFTFTLGGMAGVMLGIPGLDFQLHNSLFLVAHFHTMVIGGALFGIFAAITYWFPKVTGFLLNEKWGKRAFWLWIAGFLVSFTPLYILGLMGVTRRLDHYDASRGWQGLFMVAGLGFIIICVAVCAQIWQIIVSIKERKQNQDQSGDPWDGRTLEWSTSSPPPVYNFAVIPEIKNRDAFWDMKVSGQVDKLVSGQANKQYEDIVMPKNTAVGIYISAFLFLVGFAFVWHIVWLGAVGFVGAVTCVIFRSFDHHTEFTIKSEDVAKMESRGLKEIWQLKQ
ncbi:MAG: cbb3-type cytochrome c oxidase subunit I [Candidatus Doudnabacteria bacterium]|nr:cbb3-type cytochrome c oxidase subunit I [Candidatus Doudnabacteria bacterium]